MLSFACLTPHAPVIVPEVGGMEAEKVKNTTKALRTLATSFAEQNIETTVVISPHFPMIDGCFHISQYRNPQGNLRAFGVPEVSFEFRNDLELVEKISNQSRKANIPACLSDHFELDYGVLVPMYFLAREAKTRLLPLAFSDLSIREHMMYGKMLGDIIRKSDKKIAVVASGDLSHMLKPDSPAGFDPSAHRFDDLLVSYIHNDEFAKIRQIPADVVRAAGECGYRSFIILLGILSGGEYKSEFLSYEAPFGVGYLTCNFSL